MPAPGEEAPNHLTLFVADDGAITYELASRNNGKSGQSLRGVMWTLGVRRNRIDESGAPACDEKLIALAGMGNGPAFASPVEQGSCRSA